MGLFMVRVPGCSARIDCRIPRLALILTFLPLANGAHAADHGIVHDEWGDNGFLSKSHRILSLYDKCILTLCCAVLFICAVALLVQAVRILVDIARKERLWRQEDLAQEELLMSALEAGYAKRGTAPQYTARFGALSEQEIDVNGTRKVVLVVNNTFASNAAQDAYANWFVRWCHLQETASNYAVERRADEMTPLIDMESPETPLYLDEVMASSQGHTDEIYPLAAEGFAGAQQDLDEFTTSHRSLLDE